MKRAEQGPYETEMKTIDPKECGSEVRPRNLGNRTEFCVYDVKQMVAFLGNGQNQSVVKILQESKFTSVVGYVSRLTNRAILGELKKFDCQIIVQKENLPRPEIPLRRGQPPTNSTSLRNLYDGLQNRWCAHVWGCAELSCWWMDLQPIRSLSCSKNPNGSPMRQLIHDNFLVFGDVVAENNDKNVLNFEARAVLTGSTSYCESLTLHEDNLIYVESKQLAAAYHARWIRALSISEDLDWSAQHVEADSVDTLAVMYSSR